MGRFEFYKKLVIGLALVGFIIFVVVDSITTKYFQSAIGTFLEWVGRNPAAGFFGVHRCIFYSHCIIHTRFASYAWCWIYIRKCIWSWLGRRRRNGGRVYWGNHRRDCVFLSRKVPIARMGRRLDEEVRDF